MMYAAPGAVLLSGCLYEEVEEKHDAELRTQRKGRAAPRVGADRHRRRRIEV